MARSQLGSLNKAGRTRGAKPHLKRSYIDMLRPCYLGRAQIWRPHFCGLYFDSGLCRRPVIYIAQPGVGDAKLPETCVSAVGKVLGKMQKVRSPSVPFPFSEGRYAATAQGHTISGDAY